MLSKRLNNSGKTRYAGRYMNLTYTLPGAISMASIPELSPGARKRLKCMDYYRECGNVLQTCRYFGIAPKTFYAWKKRYNPYRLESLEERSRRPKQTRQWQVNRVQEFRILALRRQHIRYGKEKLKILYQEEHREPISSWKIQRVIEKHHLYYSPIKIERLRKEKKA